MGQPKRDEVGNRYNKLVVVAPSESLKGRAMWLCKCDCGNDHVASGSHLRNGGIQSCGCHRKESPKRNMDYPKMDSKERRTYKHRISSIKIRYDLTEEQYVLMRDEQMGCCDICGQSLDTPHIDHDHNTGEVRAILCTNCNTGIGQFKDSPKLMEAGANYLRRFKNGS